MLTTIIPLSSSLNLLKAKPRYLSQLPSCQSIPRLLPVEQNNQRINLNTTQGLWLSAIRILTSKQTSFTKTRTKDREHRDKAIRSPLNGVPVFIKRKTVTGPIRTPRHLSAFMHLKTPKPIAIYSPSPRHRSPEGLSQGKAAFGELKGINDQIISLDDLR